MTAKEAISYTAGVSGSVPARNVDAATPLISVLPLLLESPGREVGVESGGEMLGVIDQTSMLEGLGRMIAPRGDSSVITLECTPGDYSASRIARAVEDADVHLVDLLSTPSGEGMLCVTLRVRCEDPSPVVHSLERYGYEVTEISSPVSADFDTALERLLEVRTLLGV